MVKSLILTKVLTDEQMLEKEGTFISEDSLSHKIINSDTDIYYYEKGRKILLLKFRKNKINAKNTQLGWDNYRNLSKASRGRGASAGPIDTEGVYWSKRQIVNTKKWSTGYMTKDGKISNMKVNNQVASSVIGYFDQTKHLGLKLPCRLSHFARTNFEKYEAGIPFIQNIDKAFKELIPLSYQKQLMVAQRKNHVRIPKTSFSTVTINRNFRTALHRDRGDYKDGFGNLVVLERGKYQGGYTMLPQFGIGVDVRHGDFLAMDVHQWHCNSEIYETEEDKLHNASLPKVFKDNPAVGTVGLDKLFTRLTFVCYLRENMINCPDKIDPRFLTESGNSKIPV